MLVLYDALPRMADPNANYLWLAHRAGFEVIVSSWTNVSPGPRGTLVRRGFSVSSWDRRIPFDERTICPRVVLHRKLIWGRSERLMEQLKLAHPHALFSFHASWRFVGSKSRMEQCLRKADAAGIAVSRPKTYLCDAEESTSLKAAGARQTLIFKPAAGSQCEGIALSCPETFAEVLRKVQGTSPGEYVAQELIGNVALYHRRRVDLRVYAMLDTINPLRHRVYPGGVARLAGRDYDPEHSTDPQRALTGASFRKRLGLDGTNLSMGEFVEYLRSQGYEVRHFWEKVEHVVGRVFEALAYQARNEGTDTSGCFYFTGLDVLPVIAGREVDVLFLEANYVPQLSQWGARIDALLEPVYQAWLGDLIRLAETRTPAPVKRMTGGPPQA
jgi:hypothetical protein